MVKVRAFIVMAALAGCGEPSPLFCSDSTACGGGQCIDHLCAASDFTCMSGYRYHESAGEKAGECTGQGSGSGGDGGQTLPDPIETLVEGEAGKSVDASNAQDDIVPPCATNQTGRDVMFEIDVPAGRTRLYVDTYQTTFDVVLAVYAGSCSTIRSATTPLGCVNNTSPLACDTRTMQWTKNVSPGKHCIVVDEASASPASIVHVRAIHGPLARDAIVGVNAGTTCGTNHNLYGPSGLCTAPDGPDDAFFFMECSGTWLASTPVGWPGEIEARTETVQYDCRLGEDGALFTLAKPGPVWVIAHQGSGACGTVNVTIN